MSLTIFFATRVLIMRSENRGSVARLLYMGGFSAENAIMDSVYTLGN